MVNLSEKREMSGEQCQTTPESSRKQAQEAPMRPLGDLHYHGGGLHYHGADLAGSRVV